MNFRRRLETITTHVRVRIRITVPSSDPDPAAPRFLSSVETFGSLLGARARGQRKRYFFVRRCSGGFFRAFSRVPRRPQKKKKKDVRRRGGRGQFACARPVKGATQRVPLYLGFHFILPFFIVI